MFGRAKVATVVAEFIGTFVLASAILAMVGRTSFPFFAAVAGGSAVALMTLIVGSVSGAHINPAVTIAMWTVRKIETTRALVFIAAQGLGGAVAWRFNEYLLGSALKNIAGAKFDWHILVAEAVGTLVFTFGFAAAVYLGYRGLKNAVTVGISYGLGIVIAAFASNGLLNPAVAVGVNSWSIAYAVGPLLGAVVGINLYAMLFDPARLVTAKASRVSVRTNSKSTKTVRKTTKKSPRRK